MLKRPKPIEINPDFIGDKLERKQTIINLTEIVKNSEEGFVLSVNAPWGSGKTTFINFWKAYLEKEGFKTIYFNAWESDFSKEPLLVLLSKITSELKPTNIDKVDKVKKVGIKIGIAALAIGIRAATAGVLKLEDFSGEETDRAIADVASKLVEDKLNSLTAEASLQEQFRNALEDLATEAIADTERSKLVFFIDELDRCRPTYAVELLEAVKHFFSVDNIVFVLSMDKKQLGCSISTMYGSGMDTEAYLKRFIDLNYDLQMPSNKQLIEYLFEYYGFNNYFNERKKKGYSGRENELSHTATTMNYLADIFKLTPREIIHIFIQSSTFFLMLEENKKLFPHLFALLMILKIKEHDKYSAFLNKSIDPVELIKWIKQKGHGRDSQEKFAINWLEVYIMRESLSDVDFIQWISDLDAKVKSGAIDNEGDTLLRLAIHANDHFDGIHNSLPFLIKKIEFLDNINWSKS